MTAVPWKQFLPAFRSTDQNKEKERARIANNISTRVSTVKRIFKDLEPAVGIAASGR